MHSSLAVISAFFMAMLFKGLPAEEMSEVQTEATEEAEKNGAATKGAMEKCEEVMANNGLNFTSFWHGTAHGLHSLSLEEIRHYFDPEAKVQNKIPAVNFNLSSEQTILFNAPLRGYDEDFNTMALKVMAYFMLNDKPDFYQQGANILEKITHQYHMHEIYAAASLIYKNMTTNPPTDPELCPCVNDITGNGILEEMVKIAKQLKYFARQPRAKKDYDLTYGLGYDSLAVARPHDSLAIARPHSGRPVAVAPSTASVVLPTKRQKRAADESQEIITELEEEYLANSTIEKAHNLLDVSPWKVNSLVGPEQWISYQAMLTTSMLTEEGLSDFSMFMYCKLNQPDLDHAKDLFE